MYATLLLLALNAPVPLPKSPPPPPKVSAEALPGDWDCQWGSTPCVMLFRKGGVYHCDFQGNPWYGSWELKGNVLTVRECMYNTTITVEWSVRLSGPLSGEILHRAGNSPFTLVPRGTLILGPGL